MIYVDPIFTMTPRTAQARVCGNRWCHLVTDNKDLEELHQFAEKIGLYRSFFQNHPTLPHYDLTPSKRALAVKNGAVEVSLKELAMKNYEAHSEHGMKGLQEIMKPLGDQEKKNHETTNA